MHVQVFDAILPARTLLFDQGSQVIAAIVDGSSSWGTGREAADFTRNALGNLWPRRPMSASLIAQDIADVVEQVPAHLRSDDFGWSFSITVILLSGTLLETVAAGFYRVDVLRHGGTINIFRPAMLVDQLIASGQLAAHEVDTFPHRGVCIGPFAGDSNAAQLSLTTQALLPSDLVVVTHHGRGNGALGARAPRPGSAAALAAMDIPSSNPSPVILARV